VVLVVGSTATERVLSHRGDYFLILSTIFTRRREFISYRP
jgi:hypothetical protein